MADHYQIRPARLADLAGLALLEQDAFTDPWSSTMIGEALSTGGALALAVESGDGRLIGSLIARRAADEAEVLTMAVTPGMRRQGIGRRLLDAAVAELAAQGVATIWLEVRPSNQAAQRMYRAAGFVASGMRRGYYRRPTEDALVLSLRVASRGAGAG